MPLSIPFTFTGGPGNKAKASEVNANFQAVAAKFTEGSGGIADADVYSSADLNCNKLSSSPGKRLISSKFEVGAVDAAALKVGTGPAYADAAVNVSGNIRNSIVTKEKLKMRFDEQSMGATTIAAGATKEMSASFNPTTEFLIDTSFVVQSSTLDSPLARQLEYKAWYTKNAPAAYTVHLLVKNPTAGTLTFQPTPSCMFTFLQN